MRRSFSERAPSTPRTGNLLARVYGFDSIERFAEALPEDAKVADIGAGRSTFGHDVVRLLPGVRWFNVDPRYDDMGWARRQQAEQPNPHFVIGRLPHLSQTSLEPGSFDRVYSSAVLTHIILDSHDDAVAAVHDMASLLKPDGELAIGGFSMRPGDAQHLTAAEYGQNPDAAAETVVDELTPSPLVQRVLRGVVAATYALGSDRLSRR